MLEKTLESPLDSKDIQPVHPKRNKSWYSLEGLMLKLKLQYFGYLMQRANSLEKTLMLRKTEGRRRWGRQRIRWLDGITHSMDKSFSKLQEEWRTGKPGVLQSMGLQKSETLLNNNNDKPKIPVSSVLLHYTFGGDADIESLWYHISRKKKKSVNNVNRLVFMFFLPFSQNRPVSIPSECLLK